MLDRIISLGKWRNRKKEQLEEEPNPPVEILDLSDMIGQPGKEGRPNTLADGLEYVRKVAAERGLVPATYEVMQYLQIDPRSIAAGQLEDDKEYVFDGPRKKNNGALHFRPVLVLRLASRGWKDYMLNEKESLTENQRYVLIAPADLEKIKHFVKEVEVSRVDQMSGL